MTLLRATGLMRAFGGVRAVDGVDLDVAQGEVRALIGPNGAGKTTLVSLLVGRQRPDAGQIWFDGQDVTGLPAHVRVGRGMGYTFQITSIFPRLSVAENVRLAAQGRGRASGDALRRVGLAGRAGDLAGTLSYGHQRLLEIAMGLAGGPRLLILDEPTQGLSEGEIAQFAALIRSLVPDITVLLIEHNVRLVMDLADTITVLDRGRVLSTGGPAEIRANPAVQAAYLGGTDAAG